MMDILLKSKRLVLFISILVISVSLSYLLEEGKHWQVIAIVAVASLGFTILTYREDKERAHKEWLLRNKEAFLIELIDIMGLCFSEKHFYNIAPMQKRLELLQSALITHGSKDFLEAWDDCQNMSEGDLSEMLGQAEAFLRAIRKELGHDDSEIPPGHVLKIMVKPDQREKLLKYFKDVKYD